VIGKAEVRTSSVSGWFLVDLVLMVTVMRASMGELLLVPSRPLQPHSS
jgi:hypothetical protein